MIGFPVTANKIVSKKSNWELYNTEIIRCSPPLFKKLKIIRKNAFLKDLIHLFSRFDLPLFEKIKRDLLLEAKKQNWMVFMAETWFCYHPLYYLFKSYVPCGACVTCRNLSRHDFQWIIPIYSRYVQKMSRMKQNIFN